MGISSKMQQYEKCLAANQLHDAAKRLHIFAANRLHYEATRLVENDFVAKRPEATGTGVFRIKINQSSETNKEDQ